MDFFTFLFDNDYLQRSDINRMKQELKKKQSTESVRTRSNDRKIQALEDELGQTQLILLTLIEMLKEQDLWDAQAFQRLQKKVDLQDGVEDGKVTKKKPVRTRKVVVKKVRRKN